MNSTSISSDSTIFEVTEKYPATIRVLVESGFPKMGDPAKRRAQGKSLTISAAATLRKLDLDQLLAKLTNAALEEQQQEDVTLAKTEEIRLLPPGDIRVSGLLPCPVRLPILEAVRELAQKMAQEKDQTLGWSLAAASVGAGLNDQIAQVQDESELPEIFISAGFESFFDHKNFRRFKDANLFTDVAPPGQNACFGDLQLRDPEGHFTLLGVVPAIFLLNRSLLEEGEPEPRTWADVLHPRFTGRIALPVGDFDLFNGLLLHVHRHFGEDGLRALSRNMLVALHPSQTVGRFAGKQIKPPTISIIPYFFSRMTLKSEVITTVWPEDGAVISPIFMLVKRSALPRAQEVADLFLSRKVGEVLAHKGLFPVLNPEVDNKLPPGSTFSWMGWDYMREHDLGRLIPEINRIFNDRENDHGDDHENDSGNDSGGTP